MMTSSFSIGVRVVLTVFAVWAAWVAVTEPMIGRPYGQPATHEPSRSVSALTGGYQAQGRGR